MPKNHHPRRGSMQFWPRKRSRHTLVRVRSWAVETKLKPLGFIGYKVGMTHVMINDARAKSMTKGERISMPTTIIECPPMVVAGVVFYGRWGTGVRKIGCVLSPKLHKDLARVLPLPKNKSHSFDSIKEFSDVRLLVHTQPSLITVEAKKPKVLEVALGGAVSEKLAYAKDILGKELKVEDVFEVGTLADVHGTTKGKGFQGTVKRYGVPIRQHKAEKTKRGIATLGSWSPKRVEFTVPQSGKMGYHSRTDYNKHILKIGSDGAAITPAGGIAHYGILKQTYVLIKGSVFGSAKRPVLLTRPIRAKGFTKEVPEIVHISH
ncbi:50S ribosomal protein L3 [Candidatus Woesearchaeota archaeon]|nr:50S ribosomal protein L3 [Candidatus Woesearchaeota archaeon]